jgi:hypothetical protein
MSKKDIKRKEKKRTMKKFPKIRTYKCLMDKKCGYRMPDKSCIPKEYFELFECAFRIGKDEDVRPILEELSRREKPKRRRRRRP